MVESTAVATTSKSTDVKDRLALALDVDDLVTAMRLAKELQPWFGVAKIGLELFSASGPDAVASIAGCGYKIFLDAKLHDIPTTVGKAARVLGALGASYLTLHAAGGVPMLHAGVEGLNEGAAGAGLEPPTALAVTILTSDGGAPPHVLGKRVAAALDARCGGLVCAAADVREAKQLAPNLITVVPGIRPVGAAAHDQARAATPRDALEAGADLLVIGRAVTGAKDHQQAAQDLVDSVS